jgi:hypothetical protein
MKKIITLSGSALLLVVSAAMGADTNNVSFDQTQNTTVINHYGENSLPLYRGNEFSIAGFGTAELGERTIDHLSGNRIVHNGKLGLGAGASYFFTSIIGIEGDAYSENPRHSFIDNASGSLILRFPIGQTGLAPYALGGGGHQFDPIESSFVHFGGGLEFRFTPHVGIFADARYVLPDRTRDFGVGRAGFRIAF